MTVMNRIAMLVLDIVFLPDLLPWGERSGTAGVTQSTALSYSCSPTKRRKRPPVGARGDARNTNRRDKAFVWPSHALGNAAYACPHSSRPYSGIQAADMECRPGAPQHNVSSCLLSSRGAAGCHAPQHRAPIIFLANSERRQTALLEWCEMVRTLQTRATMGRMENITIVYKCEPRPNGKWAPGLNCSFSEIVDCNRYIPALWWTLT